MKNLKPRRAAGLTLVASLAGILAMTTIPAVATHVPPELITGNENCNAVTGLVELTRFDPVSSGTQDGVTIEVDGDTFDWTSTVTIAAVFVKGGPNGNLYDYRPAGETSDTGLHAPENASGGFAGLSHISFCVPDPSTTTTVQDTTTTTVEDTTTTTVEDTTTTTVEDTTTTTVEDTTTTTEPEVSSTSTSSTTTTEPEVSPTTTEADTTTTTEPEVAPTTVQQTSTTAETEDEDTDDTLPFTGVDSDDMALVALLALAAGSGLVLLTRKSAESRGLHRA